MTLNAHNPSLHPVDCPECQRMAADLPKGDWTTAPMHEHYASASAPGAQKKFDATERANRSARMKEGRDG